MDIVLATRNKKKIEEIKRITAGMAISIFTLDDFLGCPDVEEDGTTFEENAIKKAVTVARYTGKPALADDSGLEVYALSGSPGTLSARYAGEEANDEKNIEKLLYEMRLIVEEKRKARFICCIAIALPTGSVNTFYGYSEGRIGKEPKGFNGFGYDPIFYPDGYSRTFAEMNDEEKDAISHRGRALSEVQRYLREKMDFSKS
ncbi:MAG: non-canonical purine NTP pyrophosphatase [Nitrospirae bacterium CG_4_10_14_0_8_um_filter_41_23]|nr:XTP/dITP diphosphatase [Nitrospirota bacterium]OIP61197.1 MAG: non-canonical purine NTP pyrophosphatase, RdgB/HAM1 family [Nitrospirae bacterium CG2_30_41_42]PIQ93354.1 MAG: non-canonical purine NTP pyrophosphatase [Nitrospirae bacterium CG11_big_fil_rev_8_21_14_0_20_41_14]PIV41415.1 MAG: non-canonical purine NTP pyrophosphatase [Nitrospirae bacterium CG02_land_8_20_14_3_00_41_53]PIW86745.1 MAG: non-canonical purine NTP pyrophosphatase [Nitrospirae bacterium CG_4_8_14_3_um_filter_41_47]PIY8